MTSISRTADGHSWVKITEIPISFASAGTRWAISSYGSPSR